MEYLKGNETRLKPIKHIKDKRLNNAHIRMFNSNELIDFVNWHLKVCKVDERHELENLELIASFLDGNKPEEWHRKPELTNTSKTAKKLNNGLCHVVSGCSIPKPPKPPLCRVMREGVGHALVCSAAEYGV